jgi:hypothetical protein
MALSIAARTRFGRETRECRSCGGVPVTIHEPLEPEITGTIVLVPGWSGPRSGPADLLVEIAAGLTSQKWRAVRLP